MSGMLTAISYGTNPLFAVPMLTAGIGVSSILFYRYLLATIIYGIMLTVVRRRSLRINLREFAALVFHALLFSLSSIFLFSSFRYIDVGISCTLLFIYPSLVAIISAIFFGEKLSRAVILAIGTTTAGVALLCKAGSASMDARGILLALGSALLYALYIVGIRQAKTIRRLRREKLNFYIMFLGLMVYIVNLRFCADLQLLHTPKLWMCAALLAIIPTIISLETLTVAIKLIGSTKASILGALEPLTAIVVGVALFGEQISLRTAAGVALIIMGVLFIIARPAK